MNRSSRQQPSKLRTPTYLLTTTPPEPASQPAPKPNPYHKAHIVAYIPILLAAGAAGLTSAQLSADQLDEQVWLIFASSGGFLLFTFLDTTIQDKLVDGIKRGALYRFFDSYMPLLLLFLSGFTAEVIEVWPHETLTGRIIGALLTAILASGLLVTMREMGSLGRVLKPKTLDEMDDDVRAAIEARKG